MPFIGDAAGHGASAAVVQRSVGEVTLMSEPRHSNGRQI
jgi:hypothetical protein